MATCSCGCVEIDERGFAFADHRLHGAKACARQHTFGEVIRAVVDGAGDAADVARTLGEEPAPLVSEALVRLREAGVIQPDARLALADGVASQDDAEKKLVAGGTYHPGDLVA